MSHRGALRLWDVSGGAPIATLQTKRSPLAFSPDNRLVATRGENATLQLWDVQTGTAQESVEMSSYRWGLPLPPLCAFSPDGATFAFPSKSQDGVTLWNVKSKHERLTVPGDGFFAFSHDSNFIATGMLADPFGQRKHQLKVWQTSTGEESIALAGDPEWTVHSPFLPMPNISMPSRR